MSTLEATFSNIHPINTLSNNPKNAANIISQQTMIPHNAVNKSPDKDTVSIGGKIYKKKNMWLVAGGTLLTAATTIAAFLLRRHVQNTSFNNIRLPENIDFNPANTIKEAIRFGKEVLGIRQYKNINNLEYLNYVNESLVNISNIQKGNCVMPSRVIGSNNMGDAAAAMSGGFNDKYKWLSKGHDLHINTKFLDNIDHTVQNYIDVLKGYGYINQSNNLFKLPLIINETERLKMEALLNGKTNSIKDKLSLESGLSTYIDTINKMTEPVKFLKELQVKSLAYKNKTYTIEEFEKSLSKKEQSNILVAILKQNPIKLNATTPFYTIAHEMGHAQHCHSAGIEFYGQMDELENIVKGTDTTISKEFLTSEEKQRIARQVSKYATASPSEFVAETFAGLVGGKKYTKEVMDLYKHYKGPKLFC